MCALSSVLQAVSSAETRRASVISRKSSVDLETPIFATRLDESTASVFKVQDKRLGKNSVPENASAPSGLLPLIHSFASGVTTYAIRVHDDPIIRPTDLGAPPATAAASLSLPALPVPDSFGSAEPASPFERLRSALAVTKLLQARLGKFGTSFERRAHEHELTRLIAAAERRSLMGKALVIPSSTPNEPTAQPITPPAALTENLATLTANPEARSTAPPVMMRANASSAQLTPKPLAANLHGGNSQACVWLNHTIHERKRLCGGLKCLPAPRRRRIKCLPAPSSSSRLMLPGGWQPAGLLSWRGASTFRGLVVRHMGLSTCLTTPHGNRTLGHRRGGAALPLHARRSGGRVAPSYLGHPGALPVPYANCSAMARAAAAAAAGLVKVQADAAIAAAIASAARMESALIARTRELRETTDQNVALRMQLSRGRASLRRKDAHIAQVESALGQTASREASARASLRARERERKELASVRAELETAKRESEARRQQSARLAAVHERTSRNEAKAVRKVRYLRSKVDDLNKQLATIRGSGGLGGAHSKHSSAGKRPITSKKGSEFWRKELANAKVKARRNRSAYP